LLAVENEQVGVVFLANLASVGAEAVVLWSWLQLASASAAVRPNPTRTAGFI
jgi:hypothetical protein